MRILLFAAALMFAQPVLSQPAFADAGRALQRGDSAAAAHEVIVALTDALSHSHARVTAENLDALEAGLAEEFANVAALSHDRSLRWRAALEIDWLADTTPPGGRGACGGFVDVGDARVTATSTSRANTPGLARLTCTLMTQTEDEFGWIAFAAVSPGDGALTLRFRVTSTDAAVRQAAAPYLGRAMERIFAALRVARPAAPADPERSM